MNWFLLILVIPIAGLIYILSAAVRTEVVFKARMRILDKAVVGDQEFDKWMELYDKLPEWNKMMWQLDKWKWNHWIDEIVDNHWKEKGAKDGAQEDKTGPRIQ